MKITVVGAGNMGLAMTGYIASHDKVQVTLFTKKNILSSGKLQLNVVEKNKTYYTDNFICTDDPKIAFSEADIIFVTYPAFLRKMFIENFGNYLKQGAFLGFVPGYGGAEYACINLIKRGITIFGFQRVPYVARISKKENELFAGILSQKSKIYICAIPKIKTEQISHIIKELLDIPVQPLNEYLAITLAPSNPLLHIAGLYNVFHKYDKNHLFEKRLRFYEEWNNETSELLFKYDAELQSICKALTPLDMSEVVPLPVYYESQTPEEMTKKLKSIESFKEVMVPLKETDNGYSVDLNSRMFIEDFPLGVCVIKDFAKMTNVKTPIIDMLLKFYYELSGHKYFEDNGNYTSEISNTGIPTINGLDSVKKIIEFYHQ